MNLKGLSNLNDSEVWKALARVLQGAGAWWRKLECGVASVWVLVNQHSWCL